MFVKRDGITHPFFNFVKKSMETNNIENGIDRVELLISGLYQKLIDVIPDLIKAILFLVVGLFLIRMTLRLIKKRFEARNVDLSLRTFLLSIFKFIFYAILFLTVIQILGFQTTAILGALSGLVLAAGLALQGSLSNFAGGVLILLFRPFDVGDYIANNAGTEGTVERIDILYTTLRTAGGIAVFSPNGPLANSVIQNYTKITNRRFEYTVGIGYDDNIKTAKEIILKVLRSDKRILTTPAPEVFVKNLGDSAVNLTIRAWTIKDDFWSANYENQENIKIALQEAGISIPFPQREMRIISDAESNFPKEK